MRELWLLFRFDPWLQSNVITQSDIITSLSSTLSSILYRCYYHTDLVSHTQQYKLPLIWFIRKFVEQQEDLVSYTQQYKLPLIWFIKMFVEQQEELCLHWKPNITRKFYIQILYVHHRNLMEIYLKFPPYWLLLKSMWPHWISPVGTEVHIILE